jgi:hypothetical protein
MKKFKFTLTKQTSCSCDSIEIASINFATIEVFLTEFKKEIEKIREKNEFCREIYFLIDPDEHHWRVEKKDAKSLANHEMDENEITYDMIERINKIELPKASLSIVFQPGYEIDPDLFTKEESLPIRKGLLPIMEIVKEIISKIEKG